MDRITKLKNGLIAHERTVLWAAVAVFAVVFSAASLWKYAAFGYDGLDLAIFNQVFWNTANGRPFEQSIHPHSYLGDHAGFAILPLTLPYLLWPDPRMLLILQAIAAALGAVPLFFIAKHAVANMKGGLRAIPLLVALAWLANPQLQNAVLYEYHLLTTALPVVLFAMLAYVKDRRLPFVIAAFAAMLFREEVALIIGSVGFLAMLEKRHAWWRYVPLAMGAAWFVGAMAVIDAFSPDGGYKFTVYYSWLGGDTPVSALIGAITHPLRVIAHLFRPGNIEMVIGFGLPLLFLPYFAPKRLILLLAPLAIILLGAPGGSEVVLKTHYSAMFLPALFLAFIPGVIAVVTREKWKVKLPVRHLMGLIVLAIVYGSLVLGPLPAAIAGMAGGIPPDAKAAKQVVDAVPEDEAVAGSYRLLPHLSSRQYVYSMHYLYLGVTQFGRSAYAPSPQPRLFAMDETDILFYRAQFERTAWARPHAEEGFGRLEAMGGSRVMRSGSFALIDNEGEIIAMDGSPSAELELLGGSARFIAEGAPQHVVVSAWWAGDRTMVQDLTVDIRIVSEDGDLVIEAAYPLVAPFLTDRSSSGEGFIREYGIPIDVLPEGRYSVELNVKRVDAAVILDALVSTALDRRGETAVGEWRIEGLEI